MKTEAEKAAWEQQCYGCSAAEFLASVEGSIGVQIAKDQAAKATDSIGIAAGRVALRAAYGMVAMSLLSDAQEEIAHGLSEQARQTINRAKLVLCERVTQ